MSNGRRARARPRVFASSFSRATPLSLRALFLPASVLQIRPLRFFIKAINLSHPKSENGFRFYIVVSRRRVSALKGRERARTLDRLFPSLLRCYRDAGIIDENFGSPVRTGESRDENCNSRCPRCKRELSATERAVGNRKCHCRGSIDRARERHEQCTQASWLSVDI